MTTTHAQHPLGTPFSPASTADDVLAGVDLAGKNAVVTGGHSGIGLEVTRALAKAGASVTIAARDTARARAAVHDIAGVATGELDLLDPASIDAFVAGWLASGRALHVLINNAAIPAPRMLVRDARGYEAQFATSHLGHFQLTVGLLPALRAAHGARVVNVSSGAQRLAGIQWDDVHFSHGYDAILAYAQAKAANVLFAVELDRRWAADGIRGYAVHPGIVAGTPLNSGAGERALRAMGLIDQDGTPIIDPFAGKKTPQQGASTIVFAAASPLLAEIGGVYLLDNDISPMAEEDSGPERSPAEAFASSGTAQGAYAAWHSIDPVAAARLWALSESLLGA